jgi:hypothetical protein
VPAEVDLVQVAVVGEHDDLGSGLPLRRRADHVVEAGEELGSLALPAVAEHRRREVEVHLVAGGHEVVDRGDPPRDLAGPDVE